MGTDNQIDVLIPDTSTCQSICQSVTRRSILKRI